MITKLKRHGLKTHVFTNYIYDGLLDIKLNLNPINLNFSGN